MKVKHSDILKEAKQYLSTAKDRKKEQYTEGKSPYLCDAIGHAGADQGKVAKRKADEIRNKISVAINGFFSVEHWLRDVHGVPMADITRGNIQTYRHAWLKQLIKQYERAGK